MDKQTNPVKNINSLAEAINKILSVIMFSVQNKLHVKALSKMMNW